MTFTAIALAVAFSALLAAATASILYDLSRPLDRKGDRRDD
jgi:hypothetical protein